MCDALFRPCDEQVPLSLCERGHDVDDHLVGGLGDVEHGLKHAHVDVTLGEVSDVVVAVSLREHPRQSRRVTTRVCVQGRMYESAFLRPGRSRLLPETVSEKKWVGSQPTSKRASRRVSRDSP